MIEKYPTGTERLRFRAWKISDLDPFAAMCADPEVMRYFPDTLSLERTRQLIEKAMRKELEEGYCFAPVEVRATREFIGFVGLNIPDYGKPLPFDPCVEVGWRLKKSAWGQGFASEAAREWLRFGFETIGLDEIVSFTLPDNLPSRRVMERLGMRRDPEDDFLHPALADDHPMARHVLYRLKRSEWESSRRAD